MATERKAPTTIVVGGTRGIGRAVSQVLAGAGHRVEILARRPLERPLEGTTLWNIAVEDREGVRRVLNEVHNSAGPIDNVVFAQRYRGTGEPWHNEWMTTIVATKDVIEDAAPFFRQPGTSIVILGSLAGNFVAENQGAAYHVTRAALTQLVRFYAVRLAPLGIRVNGVIPAAVLKDEASEHYATNPSDRDRTERAIPLGRMASAEEIASVVEFLCSRKASYMTGQNLIVDGGLSLIWQESLERRITSFQGILGE